MDKEKRKIFRKLLSLLWNAIDSVRGKLAIIAFIALLLTRPLGRGIWNWGGMSPLWAILPIAIVFIWSLIEWLIKTEAERNELLTRLGESPIQEKETPDRSAVQHMATGGLLALALVAIGIAIGTEIISPPSKFDGWHFAEREEKGVLLHDLVDGNGKVIATLRDRDTDTVTEVTFPP